MKTHRAQLGPLAVVAALASAFLLAACGGGGGFPASSTPLPLSITTTSVAAASLGLPYTAEVRATGGSAPYAWSTAGGTLPPGLSLSSLDWRALIKGTPTQIGHSTFTLRVTDSGSRTASQSFSISVAEPLKITTTSLPYALTGRAYSLTLQATGGLPPYKWTGNLTSDAAQSVPPINVSEDGVVTGTPEWQGPFSLHVRVQDTDGRSSTSVLAFLIFDPLEILTSFLADGNVGVSYSQILSASGGYKTRTWGLATDSAPLPAGVTLGNTGSGWNTGSISGVPTQAGSFTFTVQVADEASPPQVATRELTLLIGNELRIAPMSVLYGVIQRPFSETIKAYGGTPPYVWYAPYLPPGLSLNTSTGEVSGIPSAQISCSVGFRVADSANPPATHESSVWFEIRPPLSLATARLDDAVLGKGYSDYIEVAGGKPPFVLEIVSGSLPPGLSRRESDPLGVYTWVRGTATTLGEFQFGVRVTDSLSPPDVVNRDITIRVVEPILITTASLPEGMTGSAYSKELTATGGVLPYKWYISPQLPAGLSLERNTGQISGTPTEPIDSQFVINLYDSSMPSQWTYTWLRLRIIGRLVVTTSRLPAGRPNAPYRVQLGFFGGTAPYKWSVISGALPSGLSLNAYTGGISGTPTAEGTSNFTVKVTDTGPPVQTVSRALSLTISSSLGRNDSIATATPISNGTFRASISPYADPVHGPANPDEDYYALTATPGAVVTVETKATGLIPSSPLDTVIEIVNSEGMRFSACRLPDYPYGPYDRPCLNDDIQLGYVTDSRLEFQVPGEPGIPVAFYLRVLDWSGSARPDFVYELTVSGAD